MNVQKNTGLILVVVVVALVATIGAWLFMFQPALDARSQAISDLDAAREFNANLVARRDALQDKSESFPELEEQLDQLREEFPPNEDAADVRRLINDLALDTNVTIVRDTLGIPELVTPSGSVVEAALDVGAVPYTEGLTFSGLYVTTMDIEATGTQADVARFVAELQLGDHRYFLVTVTEISLLYGEPAAVEAAAQVVETPLKMTVKFFTLLDEDSAPPRVDVDPNAPAPSPTPTPEG